MIRARLLFRSKLVYPDGAVREMVIWKLPGASRERQHGLKYRLYYGDAHGTCVVRYDNETGKGDHRHRRNREETYTFTGVENLIADFQRDIDRLRNTDEKGA